MNLVFGSILLFILISPGLIFRFSYLQGTYAKLTFKVSAVEEIFWALVPALFFQLIAILFVERILNTSVRLDIVYQLVTGNKDADFTIIRGSLIFFLLYTFILLIVSVASGIILRKIIRIYKLDLYLQFLRFGNEWHYLFSGEILYLTKNVDASKIALIQVDVVVNSSEGNMIYSGTLQNFYLSKDNGLDRIYLRNVYRRKLKDDLGPNQHNVGYLERHLDERYYAMPGDLFVVTYDDIINLNITYYFMPNEATEALEENESNTK